VVGLQLANDGDVGGLIEIPELETGHFVDHDGVGGEAVEDVDGWGADVADEIGSFVVSVEEGFDEGTGGAFAFGGGDADNRARAVVEKVFGDGGFVWQT